MKPCWFCLFFPSTITWYLSNRTFLLWQLAVQWWVAWMLALCFKKSCRISLLLYHETTSRGVWLTLLLVYIPALCSSNSSTISTLFCHVVLWRKVRLSLFLCFKLRYVLDWQFWNFCAALLCSGMKRCLTPWSLTLISPLRLTNMIATSTLFRNAIWERCFITFISSLDLHIM